ncbi:DNA mismatch repair protein [Actinomortierella wolfii]|nr:DNA mismatch repair protein [Actinomortierella wolfii]
MALNADQPVEVPTIRRLDEAVVNRIAAGEIIHRPANALKELIENSLDAHSTSIQVFVKDGGLKLLQIQDNGHGIKVEDMKIVCERFTTSKLRSFDDLSSMTTYGFRGEALASISHVAHVTITSKTKDSNCAYKASYSDGKIIPAKPGGPAEPKPCAGNNGTQITAKDLFYNVPTRRKALKSPTEEYNRILDVVNRYAIHNAGVAFTCRKAGSTTPDVNTAPTASVLDNIRQIYGSAVVNELLHLEETIPKYSLKIKAYISNANFNIKKFAFLLFINHRSVDSPSIRKAIENVYSAYLPKNTHPWVYMSLEMEPRDVDVNVHPTKREVHFMHEEEIVGEICDAIQRRLGDANTSRNFSAQTLLPQLVQPSKIKTGELADRIGASKKTAPKVYEYEQVRTDSRAQTLDSFLVTSAPCAPQKLSPEHKRIKIDAEAMDIDEVEENDSEPTSTTEAPGVSLLAKIDKFKNKHGGYSSRTPASSTTAGNSNISHQRQQTLSVPAPRRSKPTRIEVKLTSVLQLREEVRKQAHPVLTSIFDNHTFVGILDNRRALIQNELALYLVDYETLSEELFYQMCLRDFSNFGYIRLSLPASIREMVLMALDDEQELMERDEWPSELKSKEEIAQTVTKHLVSRREMLKEYFSICITESGYVEALPMVIKGYIPNLEKLPDFLWRLGSEVNWTAEKPCFQTVCREIAIFYSTHPEQVVEDSDENINNNDISSTTNKTPETTGDRDTLDNKDNENVEPTLQQKQDAYFQHMVATVIFPALKRNFIPPKSLVEQPGVIFQVAHVKELYKTFSFGSIVADSVDAAAVSFRRREVRVEEMLETMGIDEM